MATANAYWGHNVFNLTDSSAWDVEDIPGLISLQPQNILLTSKETSESDIKLIDFGIARYLNNGEEIRDIQGTPDYVAPEILNYEPITLSTDMWSIGVLTYVMLTGISPFAGDTKQETFLNISQLNMEFAEEDFSSHSPEARDFIQSLCVIDAEKRLTAKECLDHPWIQKFSNVPVTRELDANENVTQQDTEVSPLTISVVIQNNDDNDILKKKEMDDENDNYLESRTEDHISLKEEKPQNDVVQDSEDSSDATCRVGANESTPDMDIHMDIENKDTDTHEDHSKIQEEVQVLSQYSNGIKVLDHELVERREYPLVSQPRQVVIESREDSPAVPVQMESGVLGDTKCRSCNRLHPESQSASDRSRSPSSSPMGTRRTLCPSKENFPKEIREPKRFCLEVVPQQPGQVVC
ncbi:death-associated protein kinase 2-like [Lytechinus pictus]|uniref:death-associated protein kinase 2-like n=1 Tax=Lytechinus pictus TaxID=7653 RepID=UPI0030BA1DAD